MSRRTDNDSRDRTRNELKFTLQYRLPQTGDRIWEFHTRDERQALRQARLYAERGCFISLKRHNSTGRWEELEIGGQR